MAKSYDVNLNVENNLEPTIANLKALKRELKNTAAGSDEFKKLYNQIDDLEEKIKGTKNQSADWIDSLEMAGGPLGAFGAALNKLKVSTVSFGAALKATGIGLLIGLVGGLAAAIAKSDDATQKFAKLFTGLEKIFNGVFRAIEPLFNTFIDLAISALPMVSKAMGVVYSSVTSVIQSIGYLGSAIGKLIKGDFSGAWDEAKKSVTNFSDNYDESMKRFNAGTKEMTKTEKEESNKRTEARKKQLEEERKLVEEGWAKLKELRDKAKEQEEKDWKEDKEKLGVNFDKTLDTYKFYDKLLEDRKKKFEKNIKTIGDRGTKDFIDQEKEKTAILKAEEDAKLELRLKAADTGMRIGQSLRQLAGKNKELAIAGIVLEQASAIATITINTLKNAGKYGYLTPMGIAELVAGAGAVASAVVAAKQGINDIKAGTASASQMSFGNQQMVASYSTAPVFNVVGVSPINQAAQVMANTSQQPVKAYVVSKEVTTAQELDRNKITTVGL